MVIDFHTHAFPDALAERAIASLVKGCEGKYTPCSNGTISGLLSAMDRFGVDISVIQPVLTKPSQTKTLNEWAKSVEGERIVAFGGVHPLSPSYKEDIDLVVSLGLRGIKLHAEYQGFSVDEPRSLAVHDYAFSKGLVVLHHAGFDPAFAPPYHSSPKQFAHLIDEMKGGTLVLAHLGGERQWDDVEKYLVGKNVYLDTSMGFSYYEREQFLRILRAHGAHRVLFASDSPWSRADEEIKALNTLPLKGEEKEAILYRNAAALLKM